MVCPNGPDAARSGSTWIHWWSPVASANVSIRFWSTSTQSEVPISVPAAAMNSSRSSKTRMGRLLEVQLVRESLGGAHEVTHQVLRLAHLEVRRAGEDFLPQVPQLGLGQHRPHAEVRAAAP